MSALAVRSARDLAEQVRTIESFLSDGRTDEDALATCSRGWRTIGWDPEAGSCTADDCAAQHDHSVHPRETPRWQSEIDRSVDRWPRYVVLGVPKAINAMPLVDRLIVRGVLVLGIGRTARAARFTNWLKVGEYAGCSNHTAEKRYRPALDSIARAVWDEDGQPIW